MREGRRIKKVLICDYVSAMEKDYEPTMQSVRKAYGKDVEFEICAYENDKQLIQKLQGKDGLITGFLEIGETILAQTPELQCISVSGIGYSNMELEAAKKYGVTVCHIREYCTEEVAEHTFSLIGALNRNLKFYDKQIDHAHEWKYHTIAGGRNLCSQTLAVFGFGRIGKRVAQIAHAYGMKVIAVDPYTIGNAQAVEQAEALDVKLVSAEEAFRQADIITNHMNLTDENYHFFNKEAFAQMERIPIFVNVGRGGSVEEAALIKALDEGKIRAAGLDVLEAEEPDLVHCGLLNRNNVIITPHCAFYSAESIEKLQVVSGANMGYQLAGEPERIDEVVKLGE